MDLDLVSPNRNGDRIVQSTEVDELGGESPPPGQSGGASGPTSSDVSRNLSTTGLSDIDQFKKASKPLDNGSSNGVVTGTLAQTSGSAVAGRIDSRLPTPHHDIIVRVPPPKFRPLPYATGRSGLVYDVRMRFHEDVAGEHHPEDPRRIGVIFNILRDAGLVADPSRPENDSEFQLVRIATRSATSGEILLVHSTEHLEWVRKMEGMSELALKDHMEPFMNNSIYVNNLSWMCATLSAGGAIEATKAVLAGQVRNSIALIRPPGHHAEHDHPEGFCFFNNVCIAARIAQKDYPEIVRKILILDWDVHHGNGIQRDFYEDPNVLYISLHVHEDGGFYPVGPYGDRFHCGDGSGRGRNINIPWKHAHMGDGDYIYAFQQVVMPIAIEFDPDLVFISAGFDAADGDPLGECHVSPAGYSHMTHMLMQLAKGRVVSCLEGGYNLDSIAKSALSMTRVMMGEPPDRMSDLQPTKSGVRDVGQVIRQQAKFWKSMYPKNRELQVKKALGAQRLHDVLRASQAQALWDEHRMVNLFVLRNKLSQSYENQVVATENFREARPLITVFHDPPELMGAPDSRTGLMQPHNIWMVSANACFHISRLPPPLPILAFAMYSSSAVSTDVTIKTDVAKTYIDWAVKQDFAAIDVNIPMHYTDAQEDGEDKADTNDEEDSDETRAHRAEQVRELATYLWQNYIEPWDSTHVILIGIGDSYLGLVNFLATHSTAIEDVTFSFGFIGADYSLPGIPKDCEPEVVSRYHQRSQVFVSTEHPAFDPSRRRPRKRHGRIVESPMENLQEMLQNHKQSVADTILKMTEDWRQDPLRNRDPNDPLELAKSRLLDSVMESDISHDLDEINVSRDHPGGGRYY